MSSCLVSCGFSAGQMFQMPFFINTEVLKCIFTLLKACSLLLPRAIRKMLRCILGKLTIFLSPKEKN